MDINAKSSRQLGCSQSIDGCSSLNCIRRQDKDVVDEEVALHILKVSNGFYHQIQLGVASLNIPRKVGKTTRWGKVKLSKSIFHITYKTYHMTWSSQQTAPRYDLSMQRNISKQAAAMHRFSLTQQCAGPEKKKPLINRSTKMQCLNRRLGFSRALQPPSDSSIFLRGTIMPQNSGNFYERSNQYWRPISWLQWR